MKTKNNKRVKPAQKQVANQKPKALTHAEKTKQLVLASILTAMVVVLYWLGTIFKVGTVSITLTLIPIVIGAAFCETKIPVFLGLVFGVIVLLDPTTSWFLNMNIGGTVIVCLAKGAFCGLAASVVYKKLCNRNKYLAVLAAGAICPVVNTVIFLLGCFMFFFPGVSNMATAGGQSVISFMLVSFVGVNFLVELCINVVISPVIVRLLNIRKKA
ncbi:MAG: ECF transporter S component [Clostridia bacterium]|nr:ECF transporter S component [Clostridia bacterium]